MALIGKSAFIKRLSAEIEKIEGRTKAGLAEAAAGVKELSESRTPVHLDNLRPSHYLAYGGTDNHPIVEIGTTPLYSVYVHENMTNNHRVGQSKFLESALRDSHQQILAIIKKEARVK